MLYFSLVRSKLDHGSVAWNSVTITDSTKLGRVQKKMQPSSTKIFFQDVEYNYVSILETLN
jgi:hypothetical protein